MSSILKALEKVEESRASQQEGALGRFQRTRERRPAWVLPACVISGAAGAALLTFAAMGGFSRGEKKAAAAMPVAPSAPVAVQSLPAQKSVEREAPLAVATPVAPMPKRAPFPAKSALAAAAPRAAAVRVQSGAPPRALRTQSVPVKRAAAPLQPVAARLAPSPLPPSEETVASSAPAKAQLLVTGIAWQKDAGASVAMVNGKQVYVGDVVEGSRVSEILPDRVKFSVSGGTFDVPLGAGQ